MKAEIVSLYNNILFTSEVSIAVFNTSILRGGALTKESREVLIAWLAVSIGYAIRIGYWMIAAWTIDYSSYVRTCIYNKGIESNCHIKEQMIPSWGHDYAPLLLIPAILVLWGNVKYYCIIKQCYGIHFWRIFFIALAAIVLFNHYTYR